MNVKNEFLRHLLSTIRYRFSVSIKNLESDPEKLGFDKFSLGKGSRNPHEIIFHMYQVLAFTKNYIEYQESTNSKPKESLALEIENFYEEIQSLDLLLTVKDMDSALTKRVIQGPLADILTHIGQISMLQRMHGTPVPPENYFKVDLETGVA